LKLNSKARKISGFFMIMLVVGMILVTPAMACPPKVQTEQEDSNTSTDCSDCSLNLEDANSDTKVEAIELSETERKKATAQALSDKSVSKLREELVKSGYILSTEDFNVSRATTITENETITTTIVAMPFKGTNENESAVLVYSSNELGSASVAGVRSNDGEITILQYDSVEDQVQIKGAACDLCMWAALKICDYLAQGSCTYACGKLAVKLKVPAWIAVFWVTCYLVCDFVVAYEACNWSSSEICQGAGVC